MAIQQMKVKSTLRLLEAVNHLEHLVASLKEGTICIRKGEEYVNLRPCEPVILDLEADVKLNKDTLREKLSFELRWEKSEKVPLKKGMFVISHQVTPQDEAR